MHLAARHHYAIMVSQIWRGGLAKLSPARVYSPHQALPLLRSPRTRSSSALSCTTHSAILLSWSDEYIPPDCIPVMWKMAPARWLYMLSMWRLPAVGGGGGCGC